MRSRKLLQTLMLVFVSFVAVAAACEADDPSILVRSDPPVIGMDVASSYEIRSAPDGGAEKNEICTRGANEYSPLVDLCTRFGRAGSLETQDVEVTLQNGQLAIMLGMSTIEVKFGLTEFMTADISSYRMNSADGTQQCAQEVRMKLNQNVFQLVMKDANDFDGIWYYDADCTEDGGIDLGSCRLRGLVITEIWQTRLTGQSLFINRGHSVTVHDGVLDAFPCGWWQNNDARGTDYDLLGAADLISDMVEDLSKPRNAWLGFTSAGRFGDSWVSYSAGDADIYASWNRVFFDRQNEYVVHHRAESGGEVRSVIVKPVYNFEWNDVNQNWVALMGFNPFSEINDRVDESGYPKNPNDPVLKEIETVGCQNCPNFALEQIQFIDPITDEILYAMTIRGYIGSEQSLVMWGPVQPPSIDKLHDNTATPRGECDVKELRNDEGEITDVKSMSDDDCAYFLREGAIWRHLTENSDDFGFDLVGRFSIRDNSLWRTRCSGSGETTRCWSVPIEQKLDASYLFNTADTTVPWTVMQVLGEVGVRTFGMSYAYQQFAGSGLLFAMEQPMLRDAYFNGADNPELIWALDARAVQLPYTMSNAFDIMFSGTG